MRICCLLLFIYTSVCEGQIIKYNTTDKGNVEVQLTDGNLNIIPVADNALRIQFYRGEKPVIPEYIFVTGVNTASLVVLDTTTKLEIRGVKINALIDRNTGNLSFTNVSGKTFLTEKTGSRKLTSSSVLNEPCFIAEQSFESPGDEFLLGLGQFQDGHYNLRGITRRLTQVNSQIALPFIYSGKGYGLLWHQYGLTDFNAADNEISLEKLEISQAENAQIAEVTTTSGTQKISQNQSFYKGLFTVPQDGQYSVFLDLGDMGNRHFVVIDGKTCLDQSNIWLPPTASALVHLTAGEHHVQLVCKSDNQPKLSWKRVEHYTTFRSPHARMIDYIVFYGPAADTVIATYRQLSGNAPMLPLWAYGFWQCRERYTSAEHLVETVKEFRKRKLPMDVIVQDWQYWGNRGWGVPQFDEANYPNPPEFISKLHDLHAHFNISIWSNPDKKSEIGREFVKRDRFIPGTKWLDYFNPDTRKEYWNILNANMFENGVDSWWMDAVEPENDALSGQMTYAGPGDFYRLTYPLMVSKAVYEGQREASGDKRVCILTRSAFLGQQRYGTINWSGDIRGDWDTYRRQIVAGLNYTITGLPYWTTDIGGFFRPGNTQYTDEDYHELLIRWYQWSVFNPVFRMHGYMSETEPWKFGQKVEDKMRIMLNLRYRLLPYIYSEAWQVTHKGSTIMRPMIMDFNGDSIAVKCPYQFMFGKFMMAAPVIEAGLTKQEVYLPKNTLWYDFWTGKAFDGGQTIWADVYSDKIPLFIRAGSIIPLGKYIQYAGEKSADTLEIRVYKGADGTFTLYEDEGDNYNYEKGAFSEITFTWNDASGTMNISDCTTSFPGMLNRRIFLIAFVSQNTGTGVNECISPAKVVPYSGKKTTLRF